MALTSVCEETPCDCAIEARLEPDCSCCCSEDALMPSTEDAAVRTVCHGLVCPAPEAPPPAEVELPEPAVRSAMFVAISDRRALLGPLAPDDCSFCCMALVIAPTTVC